MKTQKDLVNYLILNGILKTPKIIEAFYNIDRKDFIGSNVSAYKDMPLYIGYDATISQPSTVALMMEWLEPNIGDKILDVGSGSGWTTAILANIVGKYGKVFGVELIPELVEFGTENVKKYNHYKNAKIYRAGKMLGLKELGPYDKILVSAASEKLPRQLLEQLKIGGILLIPIKHAIYKIRKIDENNFDEKKYYGFSFVPLIY